MAKCCERCHYKGTEKNLCNWGEPHIITYIVTNDIDSCNLFLAESYYKRWTEKQKKEQAEYIQQNKEQVLNQIAKK